eukprot:PhF_6_TR37143/c1_g1_i1/m.54668
MFTRALFFAALVVLATAVGPVRPSNRALCTGDHYSWKDFSGSYNSNVSSQICIFTDYEVECPDVAGLTACDLYTSVCVEYVGDENWKRLPGASNWAGNGKPKTCVVEGGFWFPDSRVVAVAQVLITSFGVIAAVILAILNCRSVNILAIIVLILYIPISIILSVSYYYLNAIILTAAAIAAVALFAERSPVYGATGMIIALSALFWVTFQAGLGHIQHHDRRYAGPSYADTFEIKCNNYYRSYFSNTIAYSADDVNPQILFGGYCGRAFLAGELFVLILMELLLILLVAAGSFSLGIGSSNEEEKKEEAPAAEAN